MKTIPYSHQWLQAADIRAVVKTLKSEYLTQGPKITEFEKALGQNIGVKYVAVFNSGTAALHAAYFALGLSEKDEFITSPLTFAATANAGLYLGAKPVFVDVESDTGNLDASKLEKAITKKTKLVVPIHYVGHPADLGTIRVLAQKYHLSVIEDACHALGASYRGQRIGNCHYSDMCAFSFHPVKHITTGEGGAVTTNNQEFYRKLLIFRNHGITKNPKDFVHKTEGNWYYEMQALGHNYRLTDIQAVLGISQLKSLNKFVEKRRKIAQIYNKAFEDNPFFETPPERDYGQNSYHLYPLRLKDKYKGKRSVIFSEMRTKGLGVQVHYIPVYWHPFYEQLGFKRGLCPLAEDFYQREISIPLYPSLTKKEVGLVIKTINKIFRKYE